MLAAAVRRHRRGLQRRERRRDEPARARADAAARDGCRPADRARPRAHRQQGLAPARRHERSRASASASTRRSTSRRASTRLVEWWRAEQERSRRRAPRRGRRRRPDGGPVRAPVLARRRGRRGRRGDRLRLGLAGSAGAGVRARVRRARRRTRGGRDHQLHDRTAAGPARLRASGPATRSSSRRCRSSRRRTASGSAARRRSSPTSTRSPTTSTADVDRARDHRAHEGDHARPPARPAGGHGPDPRARRPSDGLVVVEDAACAIGATYHGRPIGSLGPLACFSLHPRKVITTGEGGMIAVHDPEVAARLRRLRQHAMDVSDLARHSATDVVHRALPRARLQRPHDGHAGGARALPARAARRDPRRAPASGGALHGAARRRSPTSSRRTSPPYARRTWQSYAVRLAARRAVRPHRADAPAAPGRRRHAPRRHGDPSRGGVRRLRAARSRTPRRPTATS